MQHFNKTSIAAVTAALMMAAPTAGLAFADDGNGLIVPMYGWDAGWSELINAKQENSGTEIIAIINPSSGVGGSKDSHWANVADDLQDEGIKVVGYVSTQYAGRSAGDVQSEVDRYEDWYDVDGIFFDEVSPSARDYYNQVNDGVGLVILNPGAPVPESYEDIADIIIVNENAGLPSGVTSNGISESKLGVLSHSGTPSKGEFDNISDEVNYIYGSPDWLHAASNVEDQADWAD